MSPFRIVALWLSYRGADFHGYQRQGDLRTVQGELLAAFARAGLSRNPVVAGRTDRGVSARMQVLSFRLERDVAPDPLVERLNAQLPDDIRVQRVREAPTGFHAAWSATGKESRYALPDPFDRALLREAIALVPGTRDFQVFHFKSSEVKPRTVTAVELLDGDVLRFTGDGFARHMVRMLTGAVLGVARGEIAMDVFRAGLLEQKPFHCPTAAPEPLTLFSVDYPPGADPFASDRG